MGQSILAGNAKLFQKGFPASVATSCAFWVIPGRWGGGPPESAKHVCEGGALQLRWGAVMDKSAPTVGQCTLVFGTSIGFNEIKSKPSV